MRIRLFHAFASNNSGSYTIVGRFKSVEDATEVARILREVCEEHDAWLNAPTSDEREDESPLDRLARDHGLSPLSRGEREEWPDVDDNYPAVLTVGTQVVLHVSYTVTMPRIFGELMYRRGGRVDGELDHAHERLIAHITFWAPWERADRSAATERAVKDVEALLPELIEPADHDDRPPVAPCFHEEEWAYPKLSVVFTDLIAGIDAVQSAAAKHGVNIAVRIEESPADVVDPLALLRIGKRPHRKARVILWSIGDRVRAMKAVREVLGSELADAKSGIDDLPTEIVVDVDEPDAERAVAILRDAGCDAEVIVPTRPR